MRFYIPIALLFLLHLFSYSAEIPTSAPSISAPVGNGHSTTPTIVWNSVAGATVFDLWIDDLTTSTSQVLRNSSINTTSFTSAAPLADNHGFRAWVRAGNEVGWGPWSAANDFATGNATVFPPTGVPVITAPSGTNHPTTPTVTWTAVADANRYDLWIDDLATGTSQIIRQQAVPGTSYIVTVPLSEGHAYRAWVRAGNENGFASWSTAKDFGVGNAPLAPPTAAPVIATPTGTGNTTTPAFSWSAVEGSTRYDLWVDDLTSGQSQVLRNQQVTGTSFTPTVPLANDHSYRVYVSAANSYGLGPWSAPKDFGIGNAPIEPPTGIPSLTAPVGTGNTVTPTFQWTAVAGANRFDLWVDDLTAGQSQVLREQAITGGTSFTPTVPLPNNHAFKAWIRAGNEFGFGAWSASHDFGVGTAPIQPPAESPIISTPTGTGNPVTPLFQWNAVQDATKFDLWVDDITAGTSQVIRQQALSTNSFTPATPMTNDHAYRAWVRAGNDFGFSNWSAAKEFGVGNVPIAPPAGTPTVTAPTGTVTTLTPIIQWSAVQDATKYDLWVDSLTAGTTQVIRQQALVATSFTPVLPLTNEHSYRIWVRAGNDFGFGPWSAQQDFLVAVEEPNGVVNDNFENALLLTGATPLTTGSNVDATIEPGEPNHAGGSSEQTVWWKWTAPTTTTLSISTIGSNFNTLLAVYTGNAVNNLSLVAENDDADGVYYPYPSRTVFDVVAGTTYHIAIGGAYSESGAIRLEIGPQSPVNDNFANATVISGNSVTLVASNAGATREANEPAHAGQDGEHSIWWKWVAPESARYEIQLQSGNFTTLLGVYVGPSVDALNTVASVAFNTFTSFDAIAGMEYYIAIDGATYYGASIGIVTLNLRPYVSPLISIESTDAVASEDGRDEGLITIRRLNNTTGQIPITVSFVGSAFYGVDFEKLSGEDQPVTLYLFGDTLTIPIRALDDAETEGTEAIQVQLDPSTAYTVSGNSQAQINILNVEPPPNDLFANATPLFPGLNSGHNIGATREGFEHNTEYYYRTIWWKWTATKSGPISLSVASCNFDPIVSIYTGTSVDQLTFITYIEGQSGFTAVQGQEYHIRASNTNILYGTIELDLVLEDLNPGQVEISSPTNGATVVGAVEIKGTAFDADGPVLIKLEYGQGTTPSSFTGISNSTGTVQNGTLGIWDTSYLDGGIYTIRLSARDPIGFLYSATRQVNVSTDLRKLVAQSSPLSKAAPFDEGQFLNDANWRAEYLSAIEPARIWQRAAPGAGVPQLKSQGTTRHVAAPGSSVTLTAVGSPGFPVTFCCLNQGRFLPSNRNVVTVLADAQGIATVTCVVEKGRNAVLAASPKASGQIQFNLLGE